MKGTLTVVLRELLQNQDLRRWFRPVGMKAQAYALAYETSRDGAGGVVKRWWIVMVPSSNGGWKTFTTDPVELLGEWEIVTVDQVMEER